ncbi:exosortase A [Zeimonas arvi]|uniref:Exosortase A n=1 Tax=Zeimonas arvi TaxID=2498847 RepID=A0A5C8NXD6_9BURK|nr:exosortase A [Zeimonas arvi]TXL65948.1 exosortase A [Zeimonas arvi]
MKMERLPEAVPAAMPAAGRAAVTTVLAAFAFSIALSWLAFPDAWMGMVRVWMASETYTHGFIALPFAAWMVWRNRGDWSQLPVRSFMPGLLLVAAFATLWVVGRVAGVASVEQFGAVAVIPAAMAALTGLPIVAALAFPLAFLFFAVPVGDFLTPILMDYTADATVLALQWSGVPVYREGLHFMVPTGRWSVVEACSGLRYLIASLALGVLFAWLQFRTLKYRLAFIALSIVVPIVANWVRAYMIVMLGHLTNNKLAAGADHLIYGWVFFGIVMALLFWFGSRWREPAPAVAAERAAGSAAQDPQHHPKLGRIVTAAVAALVLALAARPLAGALLDATEPVAVGDTIRQAIGAESNATSARTGSPSSAAAAPGTPEASLFGWVPVYAEAIESVHALARAGEHPVEAHVYYYARQHEGREMIHTKHMVQRLGDPRWPVRGHTTRDAGWGKVEELRIGHPGRELLVWHWYQIAGRATASAYEAKGLTALSLLTGQGDHSLAAVLATPIDGTGAEDVTRARQALQAVGDKLAPAAARLSRGETAAR